jgi:predicted nucleic acid-binding protein
VTGSKTILAPDVMIAMIDESVVSVKNRQLINAMIPNLKKSQYALPPCHIHILVNHLAQENLFSEMNTAGLSVVFNSLTSLLSPSTIDATDSILLKPALSLSELHEIDFYSAMTIIDAKLNTMKILTYDTKLIKAIRLERVLSHEC